jgi:hypothetical protein
VAFSGDGERVFAWDAGKTVRAWAVKDGQPADVSDPPPVTPSPTAVSPDGRLRAEVRLNNSLVLVDTKSPALEWDRAERLALAPHNRVQWHQEQAAQAEKDKEWFAAAFHLGRLRLDRPDDPSLVQRLAHSLAKQGRWHSLVSLLTEVRNLSPSLTLTFQLAVAQASAGDAAGYRRTCRELVSQSGPEADRDFATLLVGAVPANVGSLALSARMSADLNPVARVRSAAVRVCLLQPDMAESVPQFPSMTERVHPLWRGAGLCRLKRHDESAGLLEPLQQQFALARLFMALVEIGRGQPDRARAALDKAWKSPPSQWDWEVQQEFELLRRQAENLLTPPRMDKLP